MVTNNWVSSGQNSTNLYVCDEVTSDATAENVQYLVIVFHLFNVIVQHISETLPARLRHQDGVSEVALHL